MVNFLCYFQFLQLTIRRVKIWFWVVESLTEFLLYVYF